MKLPLINSLNRQDFPDAPNWISKLLYPLQLFMTSVLQALTGGLSYQDNFSCVVQQFSVVAGAADTDNTFAFQWPFQRQPIVLTVACTNADGSYTVVYPQVSWNLVNGQIQINGVKGLTSAKKYNLTVTVA